MRERVPTFLHTAHKELWGWLSIYPGKAKSDWPGWSRYVRICSNCFGCQYAWDIALGSFERMTCKDCPFKKFDNNPGCLGGLYGDWHMHTANIQQGLGNREYHEDRASKLARAIQNFPIKDGIVTL